MASLDGTVSHNWDVRPARLRIHRWSGLMVLIAGLAAPVAALDTDPYPASITPFPSHLDLPTTLVLAQEPPPVTAAHKIAHRHRQRLRQQVKRQNDEDEDGDDDKPTRSTSERSTRTTEEESEAQTGAGDDEDEDEDEDEDDRPTQVVSEDLEDLLTTFTFSLEPSPTETEIPEDSPLPSAFDTTLPSAFRSEGEDDSCPNFMKSLLDSQAYLDCYPLSMMVWTSTSFFNARRQLASTVRVLEESCGADVSTCADFMSEAAANLTQEENCETEFNNGLSTVMHAYRGLTTFQLMYSVSCLQDPETDMYCYANAVTNLSTSSDALLYFLPYDEDLPGGSTPTCNWCNQETMAIFNAATEDREQGIANTYEGAAKQVNAICGPEFVSPTLPEAVESAAARGSARSWAALLMATAFACTFVC